MEAKNFLYSDKFRHRNIENDLDFSILMLPPTNLEFNSQESNRGLPLWPLQPNSLLTFYKAKKGDWLVQEVTRPIFFSIFDLIRVEIPSSTIEVDINK